MKATGIVRRIDDLGRVVIPKEIRRTMRLREGEPLEIFIEKGEVILRKYSPVADLSEYASNFAESFYQSSECVCIICDRDAIVAIAGSPRKELVDRTISPKLEEAMQTRRLLMSNDEGVGAVEIIPNEPPISDGVQIIAPILVSGDVLGSVVVYMNDKALASTIGRQLAQTGASFLGRILE
ncbi:MAG: AbrB/MazE/SpoVT family DNA-binding domain-containing protein [Eubacteriaceae bacterium]|nr:AbrB/MazE/SpoVT family DNA-binding domain-containing protein [Eubacteriaceae bacterium]